MQAELADLEEKLAAVEGIKNYLLASAGDDLSNAQLEVVKVHVEAIRLIITQKMEGDGGPIGQKVVAGLGAVIKKVAGETPAAQA